MKKAWWECGRSRLEPYIPGVFWGQARASMAAKDQEGIQWLTGSGAGYIHYFAYNRQLVGSCSIAQGAQFGAL